MELNGQHEWEKHILTRKHKSQVSKRRKKQTGLTDIDYYKVKNSVKTKTEPTAC